MFTIPIALSHEPRMLIWSLYKPFSDKWTILWLKNITPNMEYRYLELKVISIKTRSQDPSDKRVKDLSLHLISIATKIEYYIQVIYAVVFILVSFRESSVFWFSGVSCDLTQGRKSMFNKWRAWRAVTMTAPPSLLKEKCGDKYTSQ